MQTGREEIVDKYGSLYDHIVSYQITESRCMSEETMEETAESWYIR